MLTSTLARLLSRPALPRHWELRQKALLTAPFPKAVKQSRSRASESVTPLAGPGQGTLRGHPAMRLKGTVARGAPTTCQAARTQGGPGCPFLKYVTDPEFPDSRLMPGLGAVTTAGEASGVTPGPSGIWGDTWGWRRRWGGLQGALLSTLSL